MNNKKKPEKQSVHQAITPGVRKDVEAVLRKAEAWVAEKKKLGWTRKNFAAGLQQFFAEQNAGR